MDAKQFDAFVHAVAAGVPRRTALKALLGSVLAPLIGSFGMDGAAAKRRKKRKKKKNRNQIPLPPPLPPSPPPPLVCTGAKLCGTICIPNSECCGGCGSGEQCCSGTCIPSAECCGGCGQDLTCCSGACVNLLTEVANCGACGSVCATGICGHGACDCQGSAANCPPGTCTCGARLGGAGTVCIGGFGAACANDDDCPIGVCLSNGKCSKPCVT